MKRSTLLTNFGFSDPDHKNAQHDAAAHFLADPGVLADVLQSLGLAAAPQVRVCQPLYDQWDSRSCKNKTCPCQKLCVFGQNPVLENVQLTTEHLISKGSGQYMQAIGFIDAILTAKMQWTSEPHATYELAESSDAATKQGAVHTPFVLPEDNNDAAWASLAKRAQSAAAKYGRQVHAAQTPLQTPFDMFVAIFQRLPEAEQKQLFVSEELWNHSRKRFFAAHHTTNNWWECGSACSKTANSIRLCIETKFHRTSASDILRQIKLYRLHRESQGNSKDVWCAVTFFDLSDLEQRELEAARVFWIKMGPRFDAWWAAQQTSVQKKARCVM